MRHVMAGVALALAPGAAQAAWLPPVTIPNDGQDHVAVIPIAGPDGSTTLVYRRQLSQSPLANALEVRRVAADGTRGPLRVLRVTLGEFNEVQGAATLDGRIVLVWARNQPDPALDTIELLRLDAGGAPIGSVTTISDADPAQGPSADIELDGTAVVAWNTPAGSVRAVRIAPDADGGTIRTLTQPTEEGYDPWVSGTLLGSASVVWYGRTQAAMESFRVFHATVRLNGEATPAEALVPPPASDHVFPRVVRGNLGNGAIAWHVPDDDSLQVVTFDTTGAFRPPVTVPKPAGQEDQRDHRLAIDSSGRVAMVWTRETAPPTSAADLLHVLIDQFTGEVLAPTEISDGDGVPEVPRIVSGADAATTIVWTNEVPGGRTVRAARLAGGIVGDPEDVAALPRRASGLEVATLPGGELAAAWVDDVGATGRRSVEYTHFDRLGPALSAPTALTGTVGQPVAFSAQAADRAQPVTLSWLFGDGRGSTAALPGHTYESAGTFTATVTATDAAGNSTSRDITVGVVPATPTVGPPPPPPPAPPADTTAPRLTGLAVTPRVVTRGRPVARTRAVRIAYRLDEAATVRIAVQRRLPGRRRGAACVAPTRVLVAAKARVCVRFAGVATLTRQGTVGANRLTITRLRVAPRRTLLNGVHRIQVRATDAAGNRSVVRSSTLTVRPAPVR